MNVGTLKQVSIGAWVTLSILIASCTCIVLFAPSHFWASLAGASPGHIAGVITLVGTAFVAVFVDAKRRLAAIDAQPALGTSQRPNDRETTRTRREGSAGVAALVGVVVIGFVVGMLLSGCDGPPGAAQRSVEVATVVVMDADRLAAERYATAAEAAYEAATSMEDYRARMAPNDDLEAALRVAQSIVLAADATLDAWREGGAERWPAMAACIVAALGDVQRALVAVGLRAPPELESVLTIATGFALAACPAAPGEV